MGETVKRRGGAKISLVNHLACFLMKVLDAHQVIQVYYGNGMALCSAVGVGGCARISIHVLLGMRLEMLHFLVPTKLAGCLINFPKIL